jgi:hypothetical protein
MKASRAGGDVRRESPTAARLSYGPQHHARRISKPRAAFALLPAAPPRRVIYSTLSVNHAMARE